MWFFGVSPSLLARFAALRVFGGVARWDQRCSGGLGLDTYAFVYYLLLSLMLSKINWKSSGKTVASAVFLTVSSALRASPGEAVLPGAAPHHQLLRALRHPLTCGHPPRAVCAQGALCGRGRRGSSTSQLTLLLGWIVPWRKLAPLPVFPIRALGYHSATTGV